MSGFANSVVGIRSVVDSPLLNSGCSIHRLRDVFRDRAIRAEKTYAVFEIWLFLCDEVSCGC
jgi:hypothetical protein